MYFSIEHETIQDDLAVIMDTANCLILQIPQNGVNRFLLTITNPDVMVVIIVIIIIVVVIGARGQRGQQRGGQGGMQGLKQEMAALHGRADCGSEKRRHRQQHKRKAAQTPCV